MMLLTPTRGRCTLSLSLAFLLLLPIVPVAAAESVAETSETPRPCQTIHLPEQSSPGALVRADFPLPPTATNLATLGRQTISLSLRPPAQSRATQAAATAETVEQVFGERSNSTTVDVADAPTESSQDEIATSPELAEPEGPSVVAPLPAESEPIAVAAATPPALPAHVRAIRVPLQQCLGWYERRPLNTRDDSPWSIMHALLGGGASTAIAVGGPQGRRTSASEWLLSNQPCAGHSLFLLDQGQIRGREGPGFQGHPAQCLAIVAQSGIPPSASLAIQGQSFTVADLIKQEQRTCVADMELTFKLIGLSFYLDSDTSWESERGESWDFPKLIRLELAQPINGVTCGGTHRLMGLTCAVARRKAEDKPMEGQWWRADQFVRDYHEYTFSLQNRDGSFSTDWFRRRADSGVMDRKVQTTGHILEWLVYSVPDETLHDVRLVRAVSYLTNLMSEHRYYDWQVGYRGHALRALRLYHERVFGELPAQLPPLAERSTNQSSGRSLVPRWFGGNR